jgi:hypothetical protein
MNRSTRGSGTAVCDSGGSNTSSPRPGAFTETPERGMDLPEAVALLAGRSGFWETADD